MGAAYLREFLARVEAKIEAIEKIRGQEGNHNQHRIYQKLQLLRDPKLSETHCRICGLPGDKHVPHEHPDVPKPLEGASPLEWGRYNKAQKGIYLEGLRALTAGELVSIPLPISRIRLEVIRLDVQARLVQTTRSRYDMILEDDD